MKINPKLYHSALAVYCIAIFILSSIPGENFPKVELDFSDKIVHVVTYAILFILFFYSLTNQTKYVKLQKFALEYSLLFTGLYGITDELHQYFVPNRSCEFYDWLADFSGALFIYLTFKLYFMKKRNLSLLLFLILGFMFLINGCCTSNVSARNEKVKITLESADSWIDFMPTTDPSSKLNRFGFVIKLKFEGEINNAKYTINDFNIYFNDDNFLNKKFESSTEKIDDNSFHMTISPSQGEIYLNNEKDYPEEVKFSFTINNGNEKIKTINTPKIKIGRTY